MKLKSLVTTVATGLMVFSLGLSAVQAQSFPDKPVSLVVPWPAGGGSDILMRLIAERTSGTLGQPVVVVNKPGAGGSLGLREVAKSKADGYTLGMIATGFIAEQYGNSNAPTLDEYKVLAFVGTDPAVLAAGKATGFKTVNDFIKAAKEKPGSLRNANDQPGGTAFVAASLVKAKLGVDFKLVPYAGSAPVVLAIMSGETQTATPSVTDLIAQHKTGAVTILAVTARERHFLAPDVPTFTEVGFPLVTGTIRAIVTPAGVPNEVASKLEAALLNALNDPKFKETARNAGFTITPLGSKEASAFIKQMDQDMYPVLKESGLVKVRQK
jgi:tripartite-type tricarboxylate transporter receptor subunit TctC